jgi:hypothetical protein
MTITSNEVKDSGGLIIDSKEPKSATKRRFVVSSDTAGELDTDLQAINFTGVSMGDAHPDYPTLVAVRVESKRDVDNPLVWRVVFEYETQNLLVEPTTDIERFSQKWNLAIDAKFRDVYRTSEDAGADFSPFVNPADAGFTLLPLASQPDIGGKPIDSGGKPTSVLVREAKLIVDIEIVTNPAKAGSYLASLLQYAGRRNQGKFLGAPEGTLVYLGAQTQYLGDTEFGTRYGIKHSIAFDEFYHRIQVAQLSSIKQGQVQLGADDTSAPAGYAEHAFKVNWVQPFPRKFDFRLLGIRL